MNIRVYKDKENPSLKNDLISSTYFRIPRGQTTVWPTTNFRTILGEGTALDLSIKKWEFIVAVMSRYIESEPLVDLYCNDGESCALCIIKHYGCEDCVVKVAGFFGCSGSPWDYFRDSIGQKSLDYAIEEVTFLKSLLPKEKDNVE